MGVYTGYHRDYSGESNEDEMDTEVLVLGNYSDLS